MIRTAMGGDVMRIANANRAPRIARLRLPRLQPGKVQGRYGTKVLSAGSASVTMASGSPMDRRAFLSAAAACSLVSASAQYARAQAPGRFGDAAAYSAERDGASFVV